MPLIEELAITGRQKTTHGWAYVPDVKPQLAPLEARKRSLGTKAQAANRANELSVKQQKAIQTKLNDLDKENYKDSQPIPIPAKRKDDKAGKRFTANVRKILTYQRTFAHYLADEEALLAQSGNLSTLPVALPQTPGTNARGTSSRNATSKPSPMPPPPRPSTGKRKASISKTAARSSTPSQSVKRERSLSLLRTAVDTSVPDPESPSSSHPTLDLTTASPTEHDAVGNPLLETLPHLKRPSTDLLDRLLAEPPLSFSASRAQPLEDQHRILSAFSTARTIAVGAEAGATNQLSILPPTRTPQRHFCGICGHWGKIKCKRCGERNCGLTECWRGHEGVCTVPTY